MFYPCNRFIKKGEEHNTRRYGCRAFGAYILVLRVLRLVGISMLRRRLFAYTALYIAGIVSGYIFFEKSNYIASAVLIILVLAGVQHMNLEGSSANKANKERQILSTMLIIGFVFFGISYVNLKADSELSASEACGRCISAKAVTNGIQLTIKPDNKELGRKLLVSIYEYDSWEDSKDDDSEDDDKKGSRSSVSKNGGTQSRDADSENEGSQESEADDFTQYIGKRCSFAGKLTIPKSAMNYGSFDYALYLKSIGVKYVFNASLVEILEEENMPILIKLKIFLIEKRTSFANCFEGDARALVKGMIFGDKSEISDETMLDFNENGTGHILAVSGLHVGFVFSLLRFLTKKRRTFLVSLLIIILILMYGEMTLWSPSTIRAVLVMSISLLSVHLQRKSDLLSSISTAGLTLALINPYAIFGSGFQLSFIAMLGIAFLTKPLSFFMSDYLAMLIAVQIATSPLLAYHYNRFNPLTILINIPVVTLASVLVPLCIIGLALICIFPQIPALLIDIIDEGLDLIITLNEFLNADGEMSFVKYGGNLGLLIAFYIFIFALSSEWMRVRILRKDYGELRKAGVLVAIISVALIISFRNPFLDDEVVFVNVGQGDCTHIRNKSANLIIDGGENSTYLSDYLIKNGIASLDGAFVTHLHADHYQGIEDLNKEYDIETIWVEGKVNHEILPSNAKGFASDAVFSTSSSCKLYPIWPRGSSLSSFNLYDEDNENNTVYMLEYDGVRIMITGDLTAEEEKKMVQYYRGTDELSCDVLKIAHHGSKSSSSEEFLEACSPEIAIIQLGANNIYGHPHSEVLERLEKMGITVYRTDLNKTIGLDIRKGAIRSIDLMVQ